MNWLRHYVTQSGLYKSVTGLHSEGANLLLAQQASRHLSRVGDTSPVSWLHIFLTNVGLYKDPRAFSLHCLVTVFGLLLLLPTITIAASFKHLVFLLHNACQDAWLTEQLKGLGRRGLTETAWWWPQTQATACWCHALSPCVFGEGGGGVLLPNWEMVVFSDVRWYNPETVLRSCWSIGLPYICFIIDQIQQCMCPNVFWSCRQRHSATNPLERTM